MGKEVVGIWKGILESSSTDVTIYSVLQAANKVDMKDCVNPWSRSLWSFGRSMTMECGQRMHVMIDVEDSKMKGLKEEMEIEHEMKGVEVAYRGGDRYVSRLENVGREWINGEEGYVLEFQERESISRLRFGRARTEQE